MTEDDIETNIRVWLLEIFVGHLIGLQTDRDPVLIKKTFAAMANVARAQTFPRYDAAMSDHHSAVLEEMLQRLEQMTLILTGQRS